MRRLSGWGRSNLQGRKGQKGFTLIELLVVVTILGILAGIVTLSLVGLTTHSNVEACNSEYKTVQAAIDAYMANNNLSALPNGDQTAWTNDMQGLNTGGNSGTVPLFNPTPNPNSPNYTRNGQTQFYYKWTAAGQIIGIASDTSGTGISGCAPK